MKNNKGFARIGIIVAIIAILAAGGTAYYVGKSSNTNSTPVFPENSVFVSGEDVREQNYQPQENQITIDETANWKTYTSSQFGVEFKYPPTWKTLEDSQAIEVSPPEATGMNSYFSFFVSAHSSPAIDEKPIAQVFGTRTGYVYTKAQSVYFPNLDGRVGAYVIQLFKPTGVNEPNLILSTFKFTK